MSRRYSGRHRLFSVDDWYAWIPGRERQLSTFGYVPRRYREETP